MKRQCSLTLAVSFMIFYNVASGLLYSRCGIEPNNLKYMLVKGCYTDCKLKIGTDVEIIVVFSVSQKVDAVTVQAFTGQPFSQLSFVSGCKNNGLKCPLEIGTLYKYKGVLKVSKEIPQMHGYVTWQLRDTNNNTIVCAEFDATFVR